MPTSLGPMEIWCDAPPYPVVEGCYLMGVHSPEDVRWCRLRHSRGQACSCGASPPALEPFHFPAGHGGGSAYLIGQCSRCRTVFWEVAAGGPSQPVTGDGAGDVTHDSGGRHRLRTAFIMGLNLWGVGWAMTLGPVPAIIAAMVAKHVLVALLMLHLTETAGSEGRRREPAEWRD